ncbi:MAG TPA: iron-containing redox enzyme family protein [Pyrinomonadaceae bacterium]|jgi:pyrroloquinoline quinone (PQQ) biosynthesis protein C
MTTPTLSASTFHTSDDLLDNPVRNNLVRYLKTLKHDCGVLSREQVLVILGQWFHPLHYFPDFLSRLISVSPDIETKTSISRILWQELGEGDPRQAHERIYVSTIADGGFTAEQVTTAEALPATRALIAGYKKASEEHLSGLGFMYGTEVVDLPMVATIGELMRRCTGRHDLPWVAIHVKQEPEHVEYSNHALQPVLTEDEQRRVVSNAEEMWTLWLNFFTSLREKIL